MNNSRRAVINVILIQEISMFFTSKTFRSQKGAAQCIMGLGTHQEFVDRPTADSYISILAFCLQGRSLEELKTYISNNHFPWEYIEWSTSHNFLIKTTNTYLSECEELYIKNQLFLDSLFNRTFDMKNTFGDYTIIIAGCGGIGNFMSYAISSLSVRKIVLIDFDHIEESNLNRQFLFTSSDIGQLKTEILAKALRERGCKAEIETYSSKTSYQTLSKILSNNEGKMFCILSADSAGILQDTTKCFAEYEVPFINVGYFNDIAAIGPLYDRDHACPLCGNALSVEAKCSATDTNNLYELINRNYSAPSSFTNNALASAMAMSDIISYIVGDKEGVQSFNKRIGIDTRTLKRYELPVEKDWKCKYCGK